MTSKRMTTTMESSIHMKTPSWHSVRKETSKEIMNTDILCEIQFPETSLALAEKSLEEVFQRLRQFEEHYSRFKENNLLWHFNHSTNTTLSEEFFSILRCTQFFYRSTDGVFDPSILRSIESEGYTGAYQNHTSDDKSSFNNLVLTPKTHSAEKPLELMIDLGGIGKGYIVDQLAFFLNQHFDNFLIDAGGDIYVQGQNKVDDYPYWAIAVEHPLLPDENLALLTLTNMAVATSGRNKRFWQKGNEKRHHIIDPSSGKSASSDLMTVTVIGPSTVSAEVLAKTLFILGKEKAVAFAAQHHIPAIFFTQTKETIINSFVKPYVWTN